MDNLIRIMSLNEDDMQRVVFIKPQKEGGISYAYNPANDQFSYEVFIHNQLPYRTVLSREFASFADARRYAAEEAFRHDWEVLAWDQAAKRPCGEEGGKECGSGSCEMCKTTGGGCKSCGASDDGFAA